MIKKEFTNIFHSKSIMLLLVAIVLIPFVYSFCFLTSAWDPYGNTGKVPIAVVNNDQPTHLQGKLVNVGAQTVAKLRKDNQLGWHIVSAKKAAEGLKDNKYYTVVTIPRNFSKNAATVLDPKPKQMKMTYETNGSLNYISEVMSQVGADTLNSQIRASVTNAFASTLIAQIGNIGKQIGKAATGATQISDGTVTLDNGVNQYTIGVSQVHDGIQTMKVAAKPLSSGVQQLDDGSHQLSDGLDKLQGNIPALSSGVKQLYDGSGKIQGGLAQINGQINGTGDNDLVGGVTKLTNGSSDLTTALNTVNTSAPTLADGVQQLYDAVITGSNDNPALTEATKLLAKGLAGLQDNVDNPDNDMQNLTKSVGTLKTEVDKNVSSLNMGYGMAVGTFDISSMISTLVKPLPSELSTDAGWKDKQKALTVIAAEEKAEEDLQTAIDGVSDTTTTSATSTDTKSTDATASSTSDSSAKTTTATTTGTTKKQLQTALNALKTQTNKLKISLKNSTALLDVVYAQMTTKDMVDSGDKAKTQRPAGLQAAVSMLNSKLTTKVEDPTGQYGKITFAESLQYLREGADKLNDAVNVGTGLPMSLAGAITAINNGVNKGSNGNPSLVSAVGQMADGSSQITTGLSTLKGKAIKLSPGVTQLLNGSGTLKNGLGTLNGQVPTLSSGVNQLADGSHQLTNGLDQLNGKVPTLLDGINQLADGTTQLTDNSGALTDGTKQLKDGSKQLATGLVAGSKQVNGVHLTKATAKMFAEPSKDVQKRLTTVPNYGAALAPYVLALALFIAIIIFNFTYPMRRHDGYKTVADWFKAKIAVGTLVALAMALVEATLMMIVGLPVDHVFQFYGMTILFALSAMYMTQMLNLAFGGVGIFVALGLLTMSGSGGLFPAETISPLYEAFQKFLPMTYAINGFRNAITSGIASGTVAMSVFILIAIGVISIALMFPAIKYLLTKLPAEEK